MYNKSQFSKTNEKKVLHKVRKHWVVVSAAMLMMIGGKAVLTQTAHANVNPSSSNTTADAVNNQLNTRLVQARQQKLSINSQSVTSRNITNQAQILHNRIMEHTLSANYRSQLGRINKDGQSAVQNSHNSDTSSVNSQSITSVGRQYKSNNQPKYHLNYLTPSYHDNDNNAKNNLINFSKPKLVATRQLVPNSIASTNHSSVVINHPLHLLGNLLHSSAPITGNWMDMSYPGFQGASYSLDPDTGILTISNGVVNRFQYFKEICPNDSLVKNENKVKSIVYKNVKVLSDASAYDGGGIHFVFQGNRLDVMHDNAGDLLMSSNDSPITTSSNGEFFPNQPNLTSVDASGLDTSNVKDGTFTGQTIQVIGGAYHNAIIQDHGMFGMFSNMPKLQSVTLGNGFKTNQANMTTADMFANDSNLKQLTLAKGININPNNTLTRAELPSIMQGVMDVNNNSNQDFDPTTHQSYISEIENGTQPANTYYKDTTAKVWGSAFYDFNQATGTLTVHDGTIDRFADFAKDHPNSWLVKNEGQIKHVVFHNVKAPSDASAYDEHMILSNSTGNRLVNGNNQIANGYGLAHNVINNGEFFPNQRYLQTVDVSGLDTSNVKPFTLDINGFPFVDNNGMSGMFANMSDLTSVKFGNSFDTRNVTTMDAMFQSDPQIMDINLSSDVNFNPQNVVDTSSMFFSDKNLQSIELGNHFNTGNVVTMNSMFRNDYQLKVINVLKNDNVFNPQGLTNLNVSNVKDMSLMFAGDDDLMNTDFNNWDTHNVVSMYGMFSGFDQNFIQPHDLNLANFDTRNVKNMHSMFEFANFHKLVLGDYQHSFETSRVTDIGSMFAAMGRDIKSIGFSPNNSIVLGYHFNLPKAITYGDWTYDGPDIHQPAYYLFNGQVTKRIPIDLKSTNPFSNPLENPEWWYSSATMNDNGKLIHPGFIGHDVNLNDISLDNLRPGSFDGESLLDSDNSLKIINLSDFYLAGPEVMSWHNSMPQREQTGEILNHPGITNTPSNKLSNDGSGDIYEESNPYKNYDMLTTGPSTQELVAINLGPKITFKKASDPETEDPNELPGGSADGANYLDGTFFHYNAPADKMDTATNMADGKTRPGEWFRDRDGVSVVMYYDGNNNLVGNIINAGKYNSKSDFDTHLDSLGAPKGYSIDQDKPRETFIEKENVQTDASGKFYVGIIHLNGNLIHGSMDIPADLYNSTGTQLVAKTQVPVKMNYTGIDGTQFHPNISDVPSTIHEIGNNFAAHSLDPSNTHGTITPSDTIYWFEGNEPTADYYQTNQAFEKVNYIDQSDGNKTVANQFFSGNLNSSCSITEANAINIPDHYQLVNSTNSIQINDGTANVPVEQIKDTDTVNYVYNNKVLNTQQVQGPGNSSYDVTSSNADLPIHYQLVNPNNTFTIMGGAVHNVPVQPKAMTDTVNYQDNGTTVGSFKLNGHYGDTFTINSTNDPDLPSGYHLTNATQTYNYNGGSHNVPVTLSPDTIMFHDIYSDVDGFESRDKDDYRYDNGNIDYYHKEVQGSVGRKYSMTASILPQGWTFVDKSGNIINPSNDDFEFNGQKHTFDIAPIHKGLTYEYNKNNNNVTFVNGIANSDLSNFISDANSDIDNCIQNAPVITFSNNINTNNVTNMNGMFQDADHLKTLNFGTSFNTYNVNNMKQMFMGDTSLSLLTLPNDQFNTSKVTDMSGMFLGDHALTSLTLPQSFDTSNVTDMHNMFTSDLSLNSLALPSSFDTSRVRDMSDMFGDSTNGTNITLDRLIIQSPNTKLVDLSGRPYGIALQPLYKLDTSGDGYTAANANDFSQGNVGTFITPSNPKVTLTVQYEDATTGLMLSDSDDYTTYNHIPGQQMTYQDLGIDSLNSKTYKSYKLSNGYIYGKFIKPTIAGTANQVITVPVEDADVLAAGQWDGPHSAYYTLTSYGILKFSSHGNRSDCSIDTNSWSYAMNSDGQPTFKDDGFSTDPNALNRNSIIGVEFSDGVELPSTNDDHKGLFADMHELKRINTMGLKGSDSISTEGLFENDPNLRKLDLSNLSFTNDKSMKNMFHNDVHLRTVILGSDISSPRLSDISGMFQSDHNLVEIPNIDKLNINNVVTMDNTFRSDDLLSDIEIPDWPAGRMSSMNNMFANDSGLKTLNIANMISTDLVNRGDLNAFDGDNNLDKIILNRGMRFTSNSKLDGEWKSPNYSDDPIMFSPRQLDNLKTNLGPYQNATWIKSNEVPIKTKLYNQAGRYLGMQDMYKPSNDDIVPTKQLQLPNGYYWAPSDSVSDGVTNQNLNYNSSHETAYVIGNNETASLPVTINEDNGLKNAQKTVTVKGHYGDPDDHVVDANAWTSDDKTPVGYTLSTNQGGVDANGKLHYNFNQGTYEPNGNAGWNFGQPAIHYTAQKESVHVIFETDDHKHVQSDSVGPVYTGKSVTLPSLPAGYEYIGGYRPNTLYQVTPDRVGKDVIINVNGEDENVPVEYINQNNQQVGSTDYSRWAKVGSDVSLPTTVPDGYTLNSGQPSTYQVAYKDINANDREQVNPIKLRITGNPVTLNVQYKQLNGQNIGSLITTPNVRVGDVVDLTQKNFPANYSLAVGNGDPTHYTVAATDLVAPNYNSTRILPVYVASDVQDLTIDYVDLAHNHLLDHRVMPVHTNTTVYLTNNNVANNTGSNTNDSFVNRNPRLSGYTIAPGQNLAPVAKLDANGIYPVYTVNMQSLPMVLHVTYYDPNTNQNVGSDNITKNDAGKQATIDDTLPLPTVSNANQNGLWRNYTLDQNQNQHYYAWSFDGISNGHVLKNIVMLAHGQVHDSAPITVVKIDANGHIQSQSTVHVPVYGNAGDTISFDSSDFQGYVPQGYALATRDNKYNHVDYQNYNYIAKLMPSDAGQNNWHADGWQINHNSGYWDITNQQPLIVLQAVNDRQLLINFFNQNGQKVGSVIPNPQGSYRNTVDLQNPAEDHQSILKDYMPSGYEYGSNNPTSITYAQDPKTVNINVIGQPETVNVEYDNLNGQKIANSVDDVVTGHHVGDVLTPLPTTHLPKGYQIIDDHDLTYAISSKDDLSHTGQITRHVKVTADTEILPVKFVDHNDRQIGTLNYQTTGTIGQDSVTLPNAPKGYTYAPSTAKQNNPTQYDFTAEQMDNHHEGFMLPHTVYLNGDAEAVPVNFVDQKGHIVPDGSTTLHSYIGDTINLSKALTTPKNYQLDDNQSSQYTLMANDIQTPGQMKPIDIYVRTNQTYPFDINLDEFNQGTLINHYTKIVNVTGSDGYKQTFKSGDYVPLGFRPAVGNQPATTEITDTGLSMPSVIWKYNATTSRGNNNSEDHTTAQPITVTYYDPSSKSTVLNDQRLDGYMNQTINVANPTEDGIAVPAGYALNNNQRTIYQITTDPQNVTLNVHGVHTGASEFRIDIVRERHDGTTMRTSQNVAENGNVDSSFQIKPSSYVPVGYHLDETKSHHNSDQTVVGTITPNGLVPSTHTFYYQAGSSIGHQDDVQPINVTYYDDRTGTKEGTNVVNGYMDQTFDVSQLGTAGLNYGYSIDGNQSQIYTVSTQPTVAHIMVHGDTVTNQHNDDVATIKIYKEDPYGNVLAGQPEYAYDTITGHTGDTYNVSADDYLPAGYQLDTSHNRDQDLKGDVQSNGKISNRTVSFYYKMPESNESHLNPIHVMYEDDNDHDIVKSEMITPSVMHSDYAGKFINVIANDNADNQQSPVPHGYDVDTNPGQYTQAAFSQNNPTYIDVLVHADSNGTKYSDVFNEIDQFYDGNELVKTTRLPQTIKGLNGSSFTINAPSTPMGYVADVTNSAKVSGYVEGSKLLPGSALYKFNATNSANYNQPTNHNHAQPILVTFKNGNVTVGKSDQRVDGYMNQLINVLASGRLSLPGGYQLANGSNSTYRIGTNVQDQVIQVVPKTVSATINYVDKNNHDVVAQRSVVAPLGTKLSTLTSRYVQFVPYDYGYVSNNWDANTQLINNGQYTIYVDRQNDRAQPHPASDQNSGIIDVVYQDHEGDSVATYELSNVNAQPFNAADYIKARSKGGQMPDGFNAPQIMSKATITKFNKDHPQTLTIKVTPSVQLASATVKYEDAKTHQLIKGTNNQPLSTVINGHAGDVINYENYRQFVPQGYTYYGMGDHDDVIEDGDTDVIMVRQAKPAERIGQINVTYKDSKGHVLDTVNVSGIVGKLFNLDYYENDLPTGYEFNGVDKDAVQFADHPQDITIKIDQPKVQNYGKVTIHFVRANAEGVSPAVNGNRATSDKTLESYEVPNDVDEVMTGHIGDLFSPAEYEHNTPQGTTFDHIVKGDDISEITKAPQDLWIAVQATNGQF